MNIKKIIRGKETRLKILAGIFIVLFTIILVLLFVGGATFTDTADTDWNAGTFSNTAVEGTGATANVTMQKHDFYQLAQDVGLADANLVLALDAGDNVSVPNATTPKWYDLSGYGYDFFLGSTADASAQDPTFNGVAGSLNASNYFSFDGGDFFRYDSANEAWMENMHKNNANFTFLTLTYIGSFTGSGGVFGDISTSGGPGILMEIFGSSGKISLWVDLASEANVLGPKTSDAGTTTVTWHFIGTSINEPLGANGGFLYEDGAYKQVGVADTFDATYTSPATGSSAYTFELGAKGNGLAQMRSGSRVMGYMIWNRSLSKTEIDNFYNAAKFRLQGTTYATTGTFTSQVFNANDGGSFTDTADTDWNAGTFVNTSVEGTGATANVTLNKTIGATYGDDRLTPSGEGNTYSTNRVGGTLSNAVDGTTAQWAPPEAIGDTYFQVQFPENKTITNVTFTTGTGGDWTISGRILNETIRGSPDGSTWTVLSYTIQGTYNNNATYSRAFSNTNPYLYYQVYYDMNEVNNENHAWQEFYMYNNETYATTGTFTSQSFDSGNANANWTSISFNNYSIPGADVQLRTRTSGNGSTWTDWSSLYTATDNTNYTITGISQARYIQYIGEFNATNNSITSQLEDVALYYTIPQTVVWNNVSWTNYSTIGTNQTISVRSCDDSACSGESFTGNFSANPLTLNSTLTPNNQYFQYLAYLTTTNNSLTTQLMSVDVGYSVVTDTCTYSGTGQWDIEASDNCTISTSVQIDGSDVVCSGNFGHLTIDTGKVTDFGQFRAYPNCQVLCYNTGGCFG